MFDFESRIQPQSRQRAEPAPRDVKCDLIRSWSRGAGGSDILYPALGCCSWHVQAAPRDISKHDCSHRKKTYSALRPTNAAPYHLSALIACYSRHEREQCQSVAFITCSRRSQIVEWAFGKRMTPAERLRKHQRALEKTQRELDRERTKLENQEKKLVQDIKKNAKNGQMGAVRIQAKDLVRTRR